jgi:hypothetical protein
MSSLVSWQVAFLKTKARAVPSAVNGLNFIARHPILREEFQIADFRSPMPRWHAKIKFDRQKLIAEKPNGP